MNKVEEALWKNFEDVETQIKSVNVESEQYNTLLDERDKLRNQLIKIKQLELDEKIKNNQLEFEKENEFIKNGIAIGTFSINLLVCVGMAIKTFKFDTTSTVTSTMGRGILNNFIPKLFKRWLVYKRRDALKKYSSFYLYFWKENKNE